MKSRFGIMVPLEPIAVGQTYETSALPLHVTVLGNFTTSNSAEELRSLLAEAARKHAPISLRAESEANFGPTGEIPVVVFTQSGELRLLHRELLDAVISGGGILDEPIYTGDGFRAHATIQKSARIFVDDVVRLDRLALVDVGDLIDRAIVDIVPLSGTP